jgi:hypothetical protein
MKELIRHILKENNLKQELKKVIEDDNIFKTADLVGGMDNLKSIFKDEPEMSSLFEKLTGKVTFYYPLGGEDDIEFPLDYEIIGRRSNVHNTNHWPEINVIYDENKLTPEENEVFKDMIKFLVDLGQHSGFKSKFNDGRIFNANYLTVLELNGEDINLIDEVISFEQEDSEYLHNKLYGDSESLNESTNSEIEKNLKVINVLLSLVSWDGLCDIWVEYNPDDKEYDIRSKTVTSNDLGPSIFKIEEELESLNSSISSMGIRVYIYTPWYVDNCEDEVKFMNESVPAQVRRRNEYFDMFFKGKRKNINYCYFRHPDHLMNYLLELTLEDLYHAWFYETVTYEEWEESIPYIENYIKDRYYNETLELWINKCRGRRLYESEDKPGKYLELIKDLVEPFKNEVAVCDIEINYDEEDDMYSLYIIIGLKDLDKKFHQVRQVQRNHYVKQLLFKIKKTISGFLPIKNIYVGSYSSPNCESTSINESEKNKLYIIPENECWEIGENKHAHVNCSFDHRIIIVFDTINKI